MSTTSSTPIISNSSFTFKLRNKFSEETNVKETYSYEDIDALGSELAVKEAGKLRSEGKEYVMQDGDIVFYKFNR